MPIAEAAAEIFRRDLPFHSVEESDDGRWYIIDGLRLTGHFLMRDLLTDRAAPMHDARDRLVDRLRRAAGVA